MEANRVGTSSRLRECCVVLDTNMLMLIAQGRNIFNEIDEILLTKCRYIILNLVLEELEKIATDPNKPFNLRRKARLVIKLLETRLKDKYIVKNVEAKYVNVDEAILEYALINNCYIASNDRELRRKARRLNIPEIYLREEKQLLEASREFI